MKLQPQSGILEKSTAKSSRGTRVRRFRLTRPVQCADSKRTLACEPVLRVLLFVRAGRGLHHQVTRMRMVGNLGNQVSQCAQTPREHESRQTNNNAKGSCNVFRPISRQPQDRAE